MKYWLIASVVLNFVLGVALFFKSALNKILVEAMKERRENRKRRREALRGLHERMANFDRDYLITTIAIITRPLTLPGMEPAPPVEKTEFFVAQQKALQYLDRNDLDFPPSIRLLVARLRQEMQFPDADELIVKRNGKAILERSQAVTRVTSLDPLF